MSRGTSALRLIGLCARTATGFHRRSARIAKRKGRYNRNGKFLVEQKSDGAAIGRVGANYYDVVTWERSADGIPELGWALAREHWGHGYASEAALAVRDWLQGPRVISLIASGNTRSQGVAKRLGATPGETIELPGYGPHVIWEHPR